MPQRAVKCFALLLYAAAAVGAIWLTVRFLLPWTAPFFVAFGVAALMEPLVRSLCRTGMKRGAAAGLVTLAALALLGFLLVRLASRGVSALNSFVQQSPELLNAVGDALSRLEERALAYAASMESGSDYLKTALDAMTEALYSIPAALSQWLLELLTRTAQSSPDAVLFIVTAGIGSFFVSASYPRVLAFLRAQLPDGFRRRMEGLGQDLKLSFGGWFRAQLILMVMTFFELLVAFLLLRVRGAGVLAGVTALIDALPIFGTGFVLVPWALVSLLLGNVSRGLGLLITWALVNLVRSCVQAKLLGDQIGLDPIASLLAMYVGWRVWRVWGAVLFPILFVTLQQLNDKGVIRLWKTP